MPNVAIIIPVYNVELYLDRCVKSIINQTFTDFTLILVDDGSPDFCPDMCDNWAKKDNRITVIHKQNQGLSAARNTGIEYAKSNGFQWIFFVDSDDWIHKKTIEVLYYAAIENNVSVACCNFIKTQGEPLEDILNTTVNIVSASDFYLNKNIIATVACAKLYRTECFRNIRYPVGKIHEDEFVTYKILFACDKIAYIDAPMYAYYQNPNSIMHVWSDKRLAALDALDEQIEFFYNNNYDYIAFTRIRLAVYTSKSFYEVVNDKKTKFYLKRYTRKKIIKYRKHLKELFKNYKEIYEFAFPNFMTLYWYFIVLLQKLKIKKN